MLARLRADAARARRLAAGLDPREPGRENLLGYAVELEARAAHLEADQDGDGRPVWAEPPAVSP